MFRTLLKSIQRAYLRKSFQGYMRLKRSGNLGLIKKIQIEFIKKQLTEVIGHNNSIFLGLSEKQSDLVVRQYLYKRSILKYLPSAIYVAQLRNSKKIIFPLPSKWQDVLEGNSLNVCKLRCTFFWYCFIFMLWCHGIIKIGQITINSIVTTLSISPHEIGKSVHFEHLSKQNFPFEIEDAESYDFISWYFKWKNSVKDIDSITHRAAGLLNRRYKSIDLIKLSRPVLPLISYIKIISFLGWAIKASIFSLIQLFFGKWQYSLMLAEASLAMNMRLLPQERVAKQYLFNNSGSIYRPIWTYEAEAKGVEIIFYYYSCNCDGFQLHDDVGQNNHSSELMSWPKYLIWDEYQIEFLQRAIDKNVNYEIVGPIWFGESDSKLPKQKEKSIAIFDVQPQNMLNYHLLGLDFDYYCPSIAIKFIEDSIYAAKEKNYSIYWKRKRNIDRLAHPQFINKTKEIIKKQSIPMVNPEISAFRVIENSSFVISMPFTSTALIARDMGKPSCYYDASGLLRSNDRGAHGISIIQSRSALIDWIEKEMERVPQ